jgi:hypothetical protein
VSDVVAGMGIAVLVTRATLRGKWAGRLMAAMPVSVRPWFSRDEGTT